MAPPCPPAFAGLSEEVWIPVSLVILGKNLEKAVYRLRQATPVDANNTDELLDGALLLDDARGSI